MKQEFPGHSAPNMQLMCPPHDTLTGFSPTTSVTGTIKAMEVQEFRTAATGECLC